MRQIERVQCTSESAQALTILIASSSTRRLNWTSMTTIAGILTPITLVCQEWFGKYAPINVGLYRLKTMLQKSFRPQLWQHHTWVDLQIRGPQKRDRRLSSHCYGLFKQQHLRHVSEPEDPRPRLPETSSQNWPDTEVQRKLAMMSRPYNKICTQTPRQIRASNSSSSNKFWKPGSRSQRWQKASFCFSF